MTADAETYVRDTPLTRHANVIAKIATRLAACELAELASEGVVIHGSGAAHDEIRRLITKHRVRAPSSAAIRSMVAFQERNTDTYSADIDFVDEDGKPSDLRMLLVVDEASTERPTYTVWSVLVP